MTPRPGTSRLPYLSVNRSELWHTALSSELKPVFTVSPLIGIHGQAGRRQQVHYDCFLNSFLTLGTVISAPAWRVVSEKRKCLFSTPGVPAISACDSRWADGTALILLGFPQVLLRWPWVQGKGIGLVHKAFLHFLQGPQGQFTRMFPSHCSSAFWSTWLAPWYEQEASPPTTLKKKKSVHLPRGTGEEKYSG